MFEQGQWEIHFGSYRFLPLKGPSLRNLPINTGLLTYSANIQSSHEDSGPMPEVSVETHSSAEGEVSLSIPEPLQFYQV